MTTTPPPHPTRKPATRRRRVGDDGPRASFRQLWPLIAERRGLITVAIALSILGALASLAQPLLVSGVINAVSEGDALTGLVWTLVALVVVSAILSGLQHYLLQRAGTGVVFSSRRQLIARMLRLPISEYDARRTGDLVSRVGSDTTLLYAVLTQGLLDAVGGALTFVGALIAMLIIDPVLLALTVAVIAVSVVAVVALSGRIRVASRQQQEKVGELASGVERAVSSIRTIRAAGATEREVTVVTASAEQAYGIGVRIAKISALVVPISGIALQLSLLVVLGVGGFRVAAGALDVAGLVAFIMFLFMMLMPLGQAFGAVMSVNQALGALGRIQEIIDLPTEDSSDAQISASLGESEPDVPAADASATTAESAEPDGVADTTVFAPALEFREVSFRYPDHVVAARATDAATTAGGVALAVPGVLDEVSFVVPRGSRIALVGPSGAGKSTILGLIERFYDPVGGAILLGGIDIRRLPREALRAQLGYVEQDVPTLAGTIAENLRLAAPTASDGECEQVLRTVNLTDVLERDPLGIDAPVGEDGVMLSGGERQRLAIARALLAAPPILLLDESTSALDGANEVRMKNALDAVAAERTVVVIAHRLSTVVDSDIIVVLDHGRVIGRGTHAELLESVPLYRDLARHQLLVS